jgi:hypothetical protein
MSRVHERTVSYRVPEASTSTGISAAAAEAAGTCRVVSAGAAGGFLAVGLWMGLPIVAVLMEGSLRSKTEQE